MEIHSYGFIALLDMVNFGDIGCFGFIGKKFNIFKMKTLHINYL